MLQSEIVRASSAAGLLDRVEAIRRFNRFYTGKIGVLQEAILHSPFSLAEARVLYELAHRNGLTASQLAAELNLDPGYLSRILRNFSRRGFLTRKSSQSDARQNLLFLTPRGRKSFAPLNSESQREIQKLLGPLAPAAQARVVAAMRSIESLLGSPAPKNSTIVLREHRPGDMGYIVHRHGELYAREYGWNEEFEALTAEIASEFIRNFEPRKERCWVAEIDGNFAGCVFLVRKSDTVAKLRMLLVEPSARGSGLGGRLVDECIGFARQAGYRKITLWTNHVLHAARRLYERRGFVLVRKEHHHSFGHDLVGETWELKL